MNEWRKATKKAVTISFREVRGLTEEIETREGILIAHAEKDFVIRGVEGELYPITKRVFFKTYEVELE